MQKHLLVLVLLLAPFLSFGQDLEKNGNFQVLKIQKE